eukprot:3864449-Lingulodinium_polyedra.AAC.1
MVYVRWKPQQLFALPPRLPVVQEMTNFELILLLESRGFMWHLLPRGRAARAALCFHPRDDTKP